MYSLIKSKKSPFYQLLYISQSGKRTTISTKCKVKSDALKFITCFKQAEENEKPRTNITLKVFNKEYLQYSAQKHSNHYLRTYKSSYKLLVESFCEDLQLKSLTVQALERFFLERFVVSKAGAHLNYRTLKAAFNKAVEWNYLSSNPIIIIKMPRLPQKNVQFISVTEFHLILDAENDNNLQLLYEFARGTGMRLAEILNLTWKQVNFGDSIITIANTDQFLTKSKKERIIPMSKRVSEILQLLKPAVISVNFLEQKVFLKNGLMYLPDFISKRFKKCVKKVPVNGSFHFHNLRSSFASDLLAKGVSIFVVQKLLGHSSVTVTERNYAHLQTNSLKQAINLL